MWPLRGQSLRRALQVKAGVVQTKGGCDDDGRPRAKAQARMQLRLPQGGSDAPHCALLCGLPAVPCSCRPGAGTHLRGGNRSRDRHAVKDGVPGFAVVRIDLWAVQGRNTDWSMAVNVKEIVSTQERAEAEVARLNALNGDKEALYIWQCTRVELRIGQPEGEA